jgi:hypothetical protein
MFPPAAAAHNRLVGGSNPAGPTTQSFEPEDFPETAEKPAIGGLWRLRFSLRGHRFWPEGDFGPFVSGSRNPVSPMQIDLASAIGSWCGSLPDGRNEFVKQRKDVT